MAFNNGLIVQFGKGNSSNSIIKTLPISYLSFYSAVACNNVMNTPGVINIHPVDLSTFYQYCASSGQNHWPDSGSWITIGF